MKPSRWSTPSTLARSCEAGDMHIEWRARCALRIRVSISPRGSDIDIGSGPFLPAGLHHAGDLPGTGEVAQRDTAQFELAVIAPRAARELAAQTHPYFRTVTRQLRELECRVETIFNRERPIHHDILERLALAFIAARETFTHLVTVDLRSFGHPVFFPPEPAGLPQGFSKKAVNAECLSWRKADRITSAKLSPRHRFSRS